MTNLSKAFRISLCVIATILAQAQARQKQDGGEIRIGAIFSLTGDVGEYGQRSRKGFELAVQLVNDSGGINGRHLHAFIEDAKSSPKDAIAAYRKLVSVHDIRIIVGDIYSNTTLALIPFIGKDSVLLFAPGASHPRLRNISPWFFRNWTSDDYDGFVIAKYIKDQNIKNVGLMVQRSDYTFGLASAFESRYRGDGGTVDIRIDYNTGDVDFRSQIAKLKSRKIDAVYLVGQSRGNGYILRQAKELGFKPKWFSNLTVDTPECSEIAGDSREGVIFSTPAFDLGSNEISVRMFLANFERTYNEKPEEAAAHAYDAVLILRKAMEEVGDSPNLLRASILKIQSFPGVSGNTTFESDHGVVKDVFVKQIKGNASSLLRRVSSTELTGKKP